MEEVFLKDNNVLFEEKLGKSLVFLFLIG